MPNDNKHDIHFAYADKELTRLLAETPIQHVEFHRELNSTNSLALELAGQEGLIYPLLVLAESQTAGRGQKTNEWWSAGGALTFSLLLDTNLAKLPSSQWPQASLTTGLAVCEVLEDFLPAAEVRLKWPNDVYIDSRKACGILVETPRLHSRSLVVGIGINVNNSLVNAPGEIAALATSVYDVSGTETPLVDILIQVLNKLLERLAWIGSRDSELRDRWRSRCFLTNRRIEIKSVSGKLSGVCKGIDEDGALLLQTSERLERCLAGVVTLLDV